MSNTTNPHRYILTGAPGSGKTALIHALEQQGQVVVHEAATDVIIEEQRLGNPKPWQEPLFIDKITQLQQRRQLAAKEATYQFFDRSPICTFALCKYLGGAPSPVLLAELRRLRQMNIYEPKVFFIENLGGIENTQVRQISYEEALKFEEIHRQVYQVFGYECVSIAAAPVVDRVEEILRLV